MDQHVTRLEHGARQPRLATEADGQQAETKTCEGTEGAATAEQAMRGDTFSARRVEPGPKTNSISFSQNVVLFREVALCELVHCGRCLFGEGSNALIVRSSTPSLD